MKKMTIVGLLLVCLGAGVVLLHREIMNFVGDKFFGNRNGENGEYFGGRAIIDGREYFFKYKRYKETIRIDKGFVYSGETSKPLQVALRYNSILMSSNDNDEYLSVLCDHTFAREQIERITKSRGKAPHEYLSLMRSSVDWFQIVGEVVYNDVHVIVRQVYSSSDANPVTQGICVVRMNGKYLVDQQIKGKDPFLRALSGSEYKVLMEN